MPPPRRQTPLAYRRIFVFAYAFVGGVSVPTLVEAGWGKVPIEWAWGLYAVSAAAAALAAVLLRRDAGVRAETAPILEAAAPGGFGLLDVGGRVEAEERRRRSNVQVVWALAATAFLLGAARYVHRSYIPPFDPEGEGPQHLAAILERFPDKTFSDRTIVRGRIVAETEYSPDRQGQGAPGDVTVIVAPYEVIPDPEAGVVYPVSEGNVSVRVRPRRWSDLEENPAFAEAFWYLATAAAYGDEVEVEATLRLPEGAANPGLFDPEVFYGAQDVYANAYVSFWPRNLAPIAVVEERYGIEWFGIRGTEVLDPLTPSLALKTAMLKVMKKTIPHPESAFLAGVTLGLRYGLNGLRCPFEEPPAEGDVDRRLLVLDEFRWGGISHVLAVSGLHVTIIAVLLTAIFEGCRVPRRVYAPIVVLGLFIFCFITGARPSSMRATIMNSLVVATLAYGGRGLRASLLLAIGVAALAILLDNPKWLLQPAFSLSFMAVLALGLLTGPCSVVIKAIAARLIHPWWRPIRGPLYEAVPWLGRWAPTIGNYFRDFTGAQAAITLGMMGPLSLYYFTRFAVAGPFANFVAIPLIGVIVQLGILASLLGLVPLVGDTLALPLGATNYLLCRFFLWVAHASTFFPFPWVETLYAKHLLLYYVCLGLFAFRRPLLDAFRLRWIEARMSLDRAVLRSFYLRTAGYAAAFVALAAACLVEVPDRRLEVTVLSVGYGTSVHVRTPSGRNLLIDGGPVDVRGGWDAGERTVGQYLMKHRVDHLDLVAAASLRPEDMAGLVSVLRILPTDRLVAPLDLGAFPTDDHAAAAEALAEAGVFADAKEGAKGVGWVVAETVRAVAEAATEAWDVRRWGQVLFLDPVWTVRAALGGPALETLEADRGLVLWEEETPGGPLAVTVLHPPAGDADLRGFDRSLVLKIDHGDVGILVAHGVGARGAAEVARLPAARAKALLLPGHGSTEPVPPPFLERVGADVAVASFRYQGRGGRGQEGRLAALLETLRERGVETYRTDEDGAVRLSSDGAALEVVPTLRAAGDDEEAEERKYTEF